MGKRFALLAMMVLVASCKTSGGARTSLAAPSLVAPRVEPSLAELPMVVATVHVAVDDGTTFDFTFEVGLYPFRTVGQVAAHVPEQVMRLIMARLDGIPRLSMMAGEDIEAMLDLERKKDLMGCEATSCMAEIGGALGAELVMQGQVGRLGQRYTINVTIVNTKAANVLGRVSAMVDGTEDAIADQIPEIANQIAAKLPGS